MNTLNLISLDKAVAFIIANSNNRNSSVDRFYAKIRSGEIPIYERDGQYYVEKQLV